MSKQETKFEVTRRFGTRVQTQTVVVTKEGDGWVARCAALGVGRAYPDPLAAATELALDNGYPEVTLVA